MSGSDSRIGARTSNGVDLQRRLAAARLRRRAGDADDVAEVEVELARPLDGADQLDPPGAVDEVEEHELPHVPPGHDAAGEPPLRLGRRARVERLRLGADGSDRVAIAEVLRPGTWRASPTRP